MHIRRAVPSDLSVTITCCSVSQSHPGLKTVHTCPDSKVIGWPVGVV
jgi:hypothetical protein